MIRINDCQSILSASKTQPRFITKIHLEPNLPPQINEFKKKPHEFTIPYIHHEPSPVRSQRSSNVNLSRVLLIPLISTIEPTLSPKNQLAVPQSLPSQKEDKTYHGHTCSFALFSLSLDAKPSNRHQIIDIYPIQPRGQRPAAPRWRRRRAVIGGR